MSSCGMGMRQRERLSWPSPPQKPAAQLPAFRKPSTCHRDLTLKRRDGDFQLPCPWGNRSRDRLCPQSPGVCREQANPTPVAHEPPALHSPPSVTITIWKMCFSSIRAGSHPASPTQTHRRNSCCTSVHAFRRVRPGQHPHPQTQDVRRDSALPSHVPYISGLRTLLSHTQWMYQCEQLQNDLGKTAELAMSKIIILYQLDHGSTQRPPLGDHSPIVLDTVDTCNQRDGLCPKSLWS